MPAPTLDGAASSTATGGFPTLHLTTANTDDVIVVLAWQESNSAAQRRVTAVTSPGLSFAFRGGYFGADAGRGDGCKNALEIWWAHAPAPLSDAAITVAMDGGFDDGGVIAFGVSGCADPDAPWDSNPGLPATSTGGTVTYDTDQADDFVIWAAGSSFNNGVGGGNPADFTWLTGNGTGGGALFGSMASAYRTASAPLSGAAAIGRGGGANVSIVDALTATAAAPPPGPGAPAFPQVGVIT